MELVPQALFGLAEFLAQVGEVLTTNVFQLHPFQVVPDSFIGIQLRSIAGEWLQVNPCRGTTSQLLFHRLAPVDGGAIPQH